MGDGAGSLYRDFGALVRAHRRRLEGMTQAKLGSHVGLSRTSINNIEKGRHHASLQQLFALADALQVSPEALLPDISEPKSPTLRLDGEDQHVLAWVERVVGPERLVGEDGGQTKGQGSQ
ncbi:MAG: helix-turn-helix transcriptional regulator [Gammaproteobacteria bacterium]|nr:helix-turn-helix transcriptional regulator [Gammaproteobacteria bacterium]